MNDRARRLPLTEALTQAVRTRQGTGDDGPLLAALQIVADECRAQLSAVMDTACAEAEATQERFLTARASGDPAAIGREYAAATAAMDRLEQVGAEVETALQLLAVEMVGMTGPALQRLQDVATATQRLLAAAEKPASGHAET